MSYYETYLKRVNRYGSNTQERIQNKREHDFLVFMSKSPNRVRARNGNDLEYYDAVLQTKEYDQDEITDYLLVPLDTKIPMGTIIYTKDSRYQEVEYDGKTYTERRWINYAIDPYTSTGYNRYTLVELESELSWVYQGIKYTSFAHATGGGSGARDKNINLKFRVQFSEAGVYLPNKRYSIVMPANENLKKNMKVTLGGETWRVAGFDNISVKGVSYVTLEEYLHDKNDDSPVANSNELNNWTVTTDKGINFIAHNKDATEIKIIFYYKDELRENIKFSIAENENYTTKLTNNIVTITPNGYIGQSSLKIIIEGWTEEDAIEVPFSFSARAADKINIIGPESFYMGDTVTYMINNVNEDEFNSISLSGNCAEIIDSSYENLTITLQGKEIGIVILSIIDSETSETVDFTFEVRSIWLGGNDNVNKKLN